MFKSCILAVVIPFCCNATLFATDIVDGKIRYHKDIRNFFNGDKKLALGTKFEKPPIIDGKLDDECWGDATIYGDFIRIGGDEKELKEKTFFKVGYDNDYLYLGIICEESQMSKINVSDKPDLSSRDRAIENQDVVHVMVAPPTARHRNYVHFIINSAGEFADIRMNWTPGEVSWFHRKANLDKTVIRTFRSETNWTVEAKIAISDLWGWSDNFIAGWAFQVARMERPTGEDSSWNPMKKILGGPDEFGMLFLNNTPQPVYVEYANPIHLGGDRYVVECVLRKLKEGNLSIRARARSDKEGTPIDVVLNAPVSVVYLPCTMSSNDIGQYNEHGYSKQVDFSVYVAVESKHFKRYLYVGKVFRKAEQESLKMPGINAEKTGTKIVAHYGLTTMKDTHEKGSPLGVHFNFPVNLDVDAEISLKLFDSQNKCVGEQTIPLKVNRGEFALRTDSLTKGSYRLEAKVGDQLFTCHFSILENELF